MPRLGLPGLCALAVLTGAGALLGAEPSIEGRKWHPGHYALVYDRRFLEMAGNPRLEAEFEA